MTGKLKATARRSGRGGTVNPTRELPADRAMPIEVFSDPQRRAAFRAIVTQAFPLYPGCSLSSPEPDWPVASNVESNYARVELPCLIVWGYEDELLPHAVGYKLASLLPDAKLRIVRGAKHGLPLEYPQLCAQLIREFTETRGRDWPRIEMSASPRNAGE
jgi:pimeloyl-ACP methyl ester carboxylesterase